MPVTNLRAFQDLVAEHATPYPFDAKRPIAKGPDVYQASQAFPFSEDWFFELSGTTVTIGRQDGVGTPATRTSSLYDSSFEAEFISGGFDDASRELLAWDLGRNTGTQDKEVRVGHFVGGVETRTTFEGFNPIVVNTWPIDGDAATAGDAEVGVFYLREGFPYIFFRTKGDDFATEYVALRSPSAPFALHSLAYNGGYLEIRGLDVTHRRAAWRSLYEPAIPPEVALVTLALTTGVFESLTKTEDVGQEAASATLALTVGEFLNTVVSEELPAPTEEASAVLALTVGEFLNTVVSETLPSPTDVATAILTLTTGEFTLVAKPTEEITEDAADVNLALTTGVFEQP